MAIGYPVVLSDFMDLLPIKSVSMKPVFNNLVSRTRGGQVIVAENGPPFWAGVVNLAQCYNEDARMVRALLSSAEEVVSSFLVTDPSYKGPRRGRNNTANPTVSMTGGIANVSNVDAGFRFSIGDLFSVSYGSNPTRYQMFMVTRDRTANGSGLVNLDVTPQPPMEVRDMSLPMQLNRPVIRAKIVPGSVSLGNDYSIISDGSKFEFQQVLGE